MIGASLSDRPFITQHPSGLVLLLLLPWTSGVAAAPSVGDFLKIADQGHCIEALVFRKIEQRGTAQARAIVRAAASALAQRAQQQRSLGCEGDIAAQAIAAGADPDEVLRATAAGL